MSTVETIRTLLAEARRRLGVADEGAIDAELLLAEALSLERTRLYFDPDAEVAGDAAARYRELLEARASGVPIAYLLGRREFWSLTLMVELATLVPRPETELLVEIALTLLHGRHRCSVADLGTGTGAIALAIATERPDLQLLATDISPDALAVATRNVAAIAPGRVRLARSDWYAELGEERFDLIVSNPPYVRSDYPDLARSPLSHEPRVALDAGPDGLDALRAVIAGAQAHLVPGGHLLVEHGWDQGPAVRALMHAHGFIGVSTRRDLAGHERATWASMPRGVRP